MKYLASFLVSNLFFIMAMSYIVNVRLDFKNAKTYLGYGITVLFAIINYEFSPTVIRLIGNVSVLIFAAKILFNRNWRETIVLGILVFLLGTVAEAIVLMIASIFMKVVWFEVNTPFSVFVNNAIIGTILVILCYGIHARKRYSNLLHAFDKITDKKIVMFSLVVVMIFNIGYIIAYLIYRDSLNLLYLPVFSAILGFFSSVILIFYLKANNKYLTFYQKYNVSLENIREFETILEKYHINTHENKNQFRTIRNMSKNKKIVSYIDALLDERVADDEQLIIDTQKIPNGGLRGIIYSKLLVMKQKNIPFELVVDRKIKMNKIEKIDDYTLTDICRILGVLLDNAMENVLSLPERYIIIELYEDDGDIVISVTNNYEGYVDIENINNSGFSTKGEGHGYGLILVKELIRKNAKLEHQSQFIEDNFMQKIKIKV